jgi:uncharacterized protein (TIGR00251 family)
MLFIKEDMDGVIIKIKVQPRASKNQLAGIMDGALRVRLTAPPVDGEANEACIKFLAGVFKVPRQRVELVTGHTGRHKMVRIGGITGDEVLKLLS